MSVLVSSNSINGNLDSRFGDRYEHEVIKSENLQYAQKFTVTQYCTIDYILYDAQRTVAAGANIPGNIVAQICSGSPGGSVLYQGTKDRQTITPATRSWVQIDLTGSAVLVAATDYFLVITDDQGEDFTVPFGVPKDFTIWWGYTSGSSTTYIKYVGIEWTSIGTGNPKKFNYKVYGTLLLPPEKATDPTPANDAVNKVNFSTLKLEWDNGDNTDSVEVWMGTGGSLTKLAEGVTDQFYVVDLASVPKEVVVQWQIVSVNTAGSTDGDVWEFDPRPDKPTDPDPANGADPVGLNHTISLGSGFEHGANPGTSYKFYEGLAPGSLTFNLEFEDPFMVFWHLKLYETPYYWRLDAVNEFGTTEGTEWSFMTLDFVPPHGFGGVDGSGGGPGGGISGGVGDGGFATNKILVAVATNSVPGSSKVYYEK